jgi:hypothetical protein
MYPISFTQSRVLRRSSSEEEEEEEEEERTHGSTAITSLTQTSDIRE